MKTASRNGIVEVTAVDEFSCYNEPWFVYNRKDIGEDTGFAVIHKKTGFALPIRVKMENKDAAKNEAMAFLAKHTFPPLCHMIKNGRLFLAEQGYPYPLNRIEQ